MAKPSLAVWTVMVNDTSLTFPIYAFSLCSCGFFAHPL